MDATHPLSAATPWLLVDSDYSTQDAAAWLIAGIFLAVYVIAVCRLVPGIWDAAVTILALYSVPAVVSAWLFSFSANQRSSPPRRAA